MNRKKVITILKIVAIPTIYALLLRTVFGQSTWKEVFNMMSVSFLFLLPSIVGALTVYFSSEERVKSFTYRFFAPWVSIFVFLLITLAFAIEGWPCLLMMLPVFLLAGSLGGVIGGYFKLKQKDNKFYISILTLLPLMVSPIENYIGANTTPYKAYTYIDINAPAEKIWNNVTRVKEIRKEQDKG